MTPNSAAKQAKDFLLPDRIVRKSGDGRTQTLECIWGTPGTEHTAALDPGVITQYLIWSDALEPQGVPDPWSAAVAFGWQLNHLGDLSGKRALELLQRLCLGMYLGAIRRTRIKIKPGGSPLSLGAVLFRALPDSLRGDDAEVEIDIYQWTAEASKAAEKTRPSLPSVVAAGWIPHWSLFAATHYNSAEGLESIRKVLMADHDKILEFDETRDRLKLRDVEHNANFCGTMHTLANYPELVDQTGLWKRAFEQLALEVPAAERPTVPMWDLSQPLFPRRVEGEEWICPARKSPHDWRYSANLPPLNVRASQPSILCTQHHNVPIETAIGPVPLEALGATLHSTPAGEARLIIWRDGESDENLQQVRDTANSRVLRYASGPEIVLHGQFLSLDDIRCEPVAIPRGDSGHSARSTIPIKSEFIGLIEEDPEWNPAVNAWSVKLRGRNRVDALPGAATDSHVENSGVVVWPKKRTVGWCADLVSAFLQFAEDGAPIYRMKDDSFRLGAFVTMPFLVDSQTGEHMNEPEFGTVEYVAFRNEQKEELGCVRVVRPEPSTAPLAAEDAHGIVAVDFGTSSSVACYTGLDGTANFVHHASAAPAEICSLPSHGSGFLQALRDTYSISCTWLKSNTPSPLLGTLLVEKRDGDQLKSWAIVPREPDLLGNLVETDDTIVYRRLKWGDAAKNRPAVQRYLTRLLLPALHALSSQGRRTATVVASYPFAFDSPRVAYLNDCFAEVTRRLQRCTGLKSVTLAKPFSESQAGVRAAPGARGAKHHLTIDLGGGTSDYALWGPGGVLAADSVRVGARDLLQAMWATLSDSDRQALHTELLTVLGVAGGRAKYSEDSLVVLTETLIEQQRVDAARFAIGPEENLFALKAMTALLAAIVLVATRILRARPPAPLANREDSRPVGLTLLGQGWFLLGGNGLIRFIDEKSISNAIERRLHDTSIKISNLRFPDDNPKTRKKVVALGSMKLVSEKVEPIEHKAKMILGMDVEKSDGTMFGFSEALSSVQSGEIKEGDPGVSEILKELISIMNELRGEREIGNMDKFMEAPVANGSGDSNHEWLLKTGRDALHSCYSAEQGWIRSPLMEFLSGPWRKFWIRDFS